MQYMNEIMRMDANIFLPRRSRNKRRKAFLKCDGSEVKIIPSAKMSKSKNNVVDPVAIIDDFGADTARWFVLSDSLQKEM